VTEQLQRNTAKIDAHTESVALSIRHLADVSTEPVVYKKHIEHGPPLVAAPAAISAVTAMSPHMPEHDG
jgi:hypothetical protein